MRQVAAIPGERRLLRSLMIASLALLATGCTLIKFAPTPPDRARGEMMYLSGRGPSDGVPWEFFCTEGQNSGYWTSISVPSQWEQQGFGHYNYGQDNAAVRHNEKGLYRTKFTVPKDWGGRRIQLVFEGVMTDAEVRVNGRSAGPIHQGGFYRFRYDITDKLQLDRENVLEVDVSKVSADRSVEAAERTGDYWIFGGIYRPVYLEAQPEAFIDWTAVNARADGSFSVKMYLNQARAGDRVIGRITTLAGKRAGRDFEVTIGNDNPPTVELNTQVERPLLWSAETPNLYRAEFVLLRGRTAMHRTSARFGFRTFEVRAGEGLFLNGKRIVLKGICRHSFRPETGRSLDAADCYEDVRVMKAMNLNAVRMSHYPPDVAFLNACDELGLYVLDELAGWHSRYDTEIGAQLIREFISRDVNHPSVLFWDNGNEGGWNTELDDEFARWDPQQRVVLHPQRDFNGVNAMHYPYYDELLNILKGPSIVLSTEILHGLFDGGMGAALDDYWRAVKASPFGGGMFLWNLQDEGIVRTDQGGRVDVYATFAPDGIVGPHLEPEGSFYTAREIFSPVQIDLKTLPENFDGTIPLRNEYSFTSLDRCRFYWQLVRFPESDVADMEYQVLAQGEVAGPVIAAGGSGSLRLKLPDARRQADALQLTVTDPDDAPLWTWTWPFASRLETPALAGRFAQDSTRIAPKLQDDAIRMHAPDARLTVRFDPKTGALLGAEKDGQQISLSGGPRLAYSRAALIDPETRKPAPRESNWFAFDRTDANPGSDPAAVALAFDEDRATVWDSKTSGDWIEGRLTQPRMASAVAVFLPRQRPSSWVSYRIEISADGAQWRTLFVGVVRKESGQGDLNRYDFAPQLVRAVRVTVYGNSTGDPVQIGLLSLGYETGRYNETDNSKADVALSDGGLTLKNVDGLDEARWTLTGEGILCLDYRYTLPEGEFGYAGITFDYPESKLDGMKWLGLGPYRVWKNRLPGTWLGVHALAYNDNPQGLSWNYPNFKGYFAGLHWLRLETGEGPVTFATDTPDLFFRVGTQKPNEWATSPDFPGGMISFMNTIPPIGSKYKVIIPEHGPASVWSAGGRSYEGRLYIRF